MPIIEILNKKFHPWLPEGYVFRLPTEAEWEYALKANSKSKKNPYVQYRASAQDIVKISVQQDLHDATLSPVGTKEPNPWGLYDMIGLGIEAMLDTVPTLDPTVVIVGDWNWIIKLNYSGETIDPVFLYEGAGMKRIHRGYAPAVEGNKSVQERCLAIRLCIGPDLMKEKKIKFKADKK